MCTARQILRGKDTHFIARMHSRNRAGFERVTAGGIARGEPDQFVARAAVQSALMGWLLSFTGVRTQFSNA